jgi:hypothetical protein
MKLTGENGSTRGKTCLSATFSTTNFTWTDPGSNSGLRGGWPATNRLSHGTTHFPTYELKPLAILQNLLFRNLWLHTFECRRVHSPVLVKEVCRNHITMLSKIQHLIL